jgi:hypothetical protein
VRSGHAAGARLRGLYGLPDQVFLIFYFAKKIFMIDVRYFQKR